MWLTTVYTDVSTPVSPDTSQTPSVMNSTSEHLLFQIETTQIQEGGSDCGLFAIAFATEFCLAIMPSATGNEIQLYGKN